MNETGVVLSRTARVFAVAGAVMQRYRTLLAVLVGLSLPAARMASDSFAVSVGDITQLAVLAGLYLFALVTICWPWTSYALALRLSLAAAIGLACAGLVNILVRDLGGTRLVPWVVPVGVVLVDAVFWGAGFAILSGFVFVRMRFWPVYPPGHCQRCGYDLFGLESARCPECGTAFVSKKIIEEGMCQKEPGSRQHTLSQKLSCGEGSVSKPNGGRC